MERILIIAPNWVGDVVMATPTLRAIRQGRPEAHLAVLARPAGGEVLADCPWLDQVICATRQTGLAGLARQLRGQRFDVAVLMPNSLRSAMLAWLARIPRRVGYARDGRALLLTDRLRPIKQGRKFAVESMPVYYARLAEALGCRVERGELELFTGPADRAAVDALLARLPTGGTGRFALTDPPAGPLVVLNPGGAFGPSKYWPAERFGQLADRLLDRFGGRVVVSGAPGEKPIVDAVAESMRHPATRLTDSPIRLSAVRELVRRADLLVTNDTGPRHFAIAFGTPVVTLFGSTDPAWTETHCRWEREVRVELACSPCQKKVCPPGHHDCMRRMSVEQVEAAAVDLLTGRPGRGESVSAEPGRGK